MKKIGIDIDDTIVKVWYQDIIDNYNKKYNKNLVFDDIKTHDFNGCEKLKKEFFDFYYSNHRNLDLFDGVKEKLEKLKLDYKLYLITSRPTRDIEFTRDYIDNIFGENYFEDIVFTCEHNDDKKCELSKKYKFDIVIDDAPHHIENYLNNTDIKKIIIFDQPWNRFISEDSKRLFRVKSWSDINFKIKYD